MNAVNRPDIRMVERRQEACLAFEARPSVGIGHPEIGQDFESHITAERRVADTIDQAHAAGAEQSGYLVRSETLARCERGSLVVKDARDRAEHTSAHVAIDRRVEDRSVVCIGGQERFDFGLQRAVIAAHVTYEDCAVLDTTGDHCIENLFHARPALGLAHVDSCDRPVVMRRWSHAFALLSSLATVDRETDMPRATSSSVRPPK